MYGIMRAKEDPTARLDGRRKKGSMAEIFISYRRDDTGILCERLADRLSARFGARRVFRDTSRIWGSGP